MKKQAPPAPLDESKFPNLKRKAGDAQTNTAAKKRRASDEEGAGPRLIANSGLKRSTKGTFAEKGSPKSMVRIRQKGDRAELSNGRTKANGDDSTKMNGGANRGSKRSQELKAMNGLGEAAQKAVDRDDKVSNGAEDDFADFSTGSNVSMRSSGSEDNAAEGSIDDFGLDDSNSNSVVDSDEDHVQSRTLFSDDDAESDASETLNAANIEGLSLKLDAQNQQHSNAAQAELQSSALQTNIAAEIPIEDPNSQSLAPDLQLLRSRMTEIIRILSSFSTLADPNRPRKSYLDQLIQDICTYYGYSTFLATKLLSLFPPAEAFAFFEANESPRPLTIRTNTLRCSRRQLAQSLINRGVTLEPIGKWSKVGLQVFESAVPLGATPDYLAGKYMIQAASSLLPVMALAPQEGERILDMAAAPGGKTTHMAALMRNTGVIFANDANKSRAKALIGNIHRMGVKNTIVCSYDARQFPKIMGGFDRVLLDAPCSGTGVIAKDPSVKTNKTDKDFLALPYLQRQILLAAIDSVDHASKTGGYIVYSTCSVTVEENEQVVQYALSRRPNVKIVETGLSFGEEGFKGYFGKRFDGKMTWARRYYPHRFNVDGFFVCKLRKTGPSSKAQGGPNSNGAADIADNIDAQGVVHVANGDSTPAGSGKKGRGEAGKPALDDDDDADEGDDNFGGFHDEEDEALIERAQRSMDRKKGRDPRAHKRPKTRNG